MKPIRLMAGFFTVGIWTLLSRVMGFVRDIMIAAFLGTGPVAEAFLIAFSLPNLFRRFFAEGAFNMAFVPMFSKKLEADEGAQKFAQDAFVALAAILTAFTVIGVIVMPVLVTMMASGYIGSERFDLAVYFGRIAFPYILFISLAALLSGVLNATGRFAAAAAAPVLLNIIFITAILLAVIFGQDGPGEIGSALAYAVPVAGVAQMAMVWVAAKRAGYALHPGWPKFTPELKRLAMIAAPAALAGGVLQINLLVGRQVASFFDGAVAWLNYADRLYQLPLGVVGIAIGVVLLPDLSRRLRAGDDNGGRDAFNRACEFCLALTVPAAAALLAIPDALVSTLFERGAFTAEDTAATALAVAIYGLGLPAFVMQKTLQPLYFAREDTKRPFYFAVAAMFLNAGLAVGLSPIIGFTAAAVGTTVTGWAMALLLWVGSRNMGNAARFDARLIRRVWRICTAAAAMGLLLWLIPPLPLPRGIELCVLVTVGIVSYFGIGHLIGAFRLSEFRSALRR
ncbi:murein biosynthesis integral membrane protein MurJ [Yoonia sediminilitoris]|uniref:Probable lipid II flippase MurJ n=1 Tax=Yoonia sediminilitoris TaxID=1286148 RepID=A0A2T6KK98_9RHOB|nr:murein biosynthesis integral membrane protein MurJ [Yoonia sediminilitoris]PUB16352.1 putative peptidoglycan lipid II flippase [Yoonia sediminilitoris]RCW96701.1 putative peptidoglycan lipid II flippase [Yoonia sediminilitoris]